MVNIGIIGCGYMSQFHCQGYEQAGVNIVHVADLNEEVAKEVGKRYNAKASTDYRAVLNDPNVDLVSILTFSSLHKEICLAAIAAGKGIVCEKTLTDDPAASAEVALAAQKAGTFLATAYMKRFFPASQKAKELLSGMGKIISIYARSWQPAGDMWNCPVEDGQTDEPSEVQQKYSGGTLVCGGSHILDLIHWFGGRPTQVCGQIYHREGWDFDLQSNAMMWLEDGGIVHFEACWHPMTQIGYERNGWDERFEINTTNGRLELYTVTWNTPENNGALLIHHDAATCQTMEYRFPAVNAFHIEIAEMIRRFEAKEQSFPSAWDGYVVDELIASISESAKLQKILPMNYKG